ncbi:MAG: endolytic transglycosylase MltG [Fidelibacterota bacterium]
MADHSAYRTIGFVLTVVIFSAATFYALVVFWPLPPRDDPVKIEVAKGSSVQEIARLLKSEGVVDNPDAFVLATQLMGYERSIQAGVFSVGPARSNFAVIHQLVNGTPVIHRITIHEGSTLEQIAALLQGRLGLESEEFLALCSDSRFIRSLQLDVPSLEGFLYPETYHFYEGQSGKDILKIMVDQFREIYDDSLRHRAGELEMTELEVVTLASIIEGEAIYDSERPIISAVYHNRLKKGMKLQADPTIQYLIKGGARRILNRDLEIDSPYNTYLYHGLPPGPINSPGRESIVAALYPADVDYLYFVANGDGYHTFSRTEKEHLRAKRKFQKYRRSLKKTARSPTDLVERKEER